MSPTKPFFPAPANLPPGADVGLILAGLRGDHVYAPAADEAALEGVVANAKSRGIELSIVVVPDLPANDRQLRDLATKVGEQTHGTVLVLGRDLVGTNSDSIPRVRIDAAEDVAEGQHGDYVGAAERFLNEVSQPGLPFTEITLLLCGVTAAIAAATAAAKRKRAKRAPAVELIDAL
ncbi:MAG: hypothetical protein LLG14_16940 [Nocardiaceae bacterium]|nr:hypothetical protein [Nocardiaceae bacterium]